MCRLLFLTVLLSFAMGWGQSDGLHAGEEKTVRPAPQTPVDNPIIIDLQGERPEEIRKALRQTCMVEISKMTIKQAAEKLSKQWGLNLTVDEGAFVEDGINLDTELSLTAIGVQRGSALMSLVRDLKTVSYLIDRESVVITTKTACGLQRPLRVYDVRELVPRGEPTEMDALINLVQSAVNPDSWQEYGGSDSIQQLKIADSPAILIMTTEQTHVLIERLFIELRRLNRAQRNRRLQVRAVGANPLEARLEKRVSINWKQKPLREAYRELAALIEVPLLFNERALKDSDITLELPVTLTADNLTVASLFSAVHHLETRVDWTFVKDILLVTTAERVKHEVRLYDVSELVRFNDLGINPPQNAPDQKKPEKPPAGKLAVDFTNLMDVVMRHVNPDEWERGNGDMGDCEIEGIQFLRIRQSPRVHREIEELLRDLRERTAIKPLRREDVAAAVTELKEKKEAQPTASAKKKRKADAAPLTVTPAVEALVAGNTQFAFDLYRKVAKPGENVVFSPISISSALALLQPGVKGETADELNKVLGYKLPTNELHPIFKSVLDHLDSIGGGIELQFANRLWWDRRNEPLLPEYLRTIRERYDAEPGVIDFSARDEAVRTMNSWIEQNTASPIKDSVKKEEINVDLTRMALANVAYLDAVWAMPFSREATRTGEFRTGQERVSVKFMHQQMARRLGKLDGVQILELNYGEDGIQRGALSMLVLLPEKEGAAALEKLETSLSPGKLKEFRKSLEACTVITHLPKFHLRTAVSLKDSLTALGLKQIWRFGQADFSGMTTQKGLALQTVIHETDIEVMEEGTRAAASTWMGGGMGGGGIQTFRANHPFLFLIQDNHTGAILFLGRVMKP